MRKDFIPPAEGPPMDRLRVPDQDRWRQDLLSDLGTRDLFGDGERKDLLSDPGVQDLIRDAGVRDLVLLGLPVTERFSAGARVLLSSQVSGGISLSRSKPRIDSRSASRRAFPSAARDPHSPRRTRRKGVSA